MPSTHTPDESLILMSEVYTEIWSLSRDLLIDVLDLKQDSWQDTLQGRFRHQFGTHLQGRLTRKINKATSAIETNANKIANTLPSVFAARYIAGGAKQIAAFRATNIDLIKSVPDLMIKRAHTIISANPDLHPSELSKKLLDSADGVRSRAELWARDQTLKLNAQIVRAKHESIGITEYIWRGTKDERERGNPSNPATKPGCADHWILNDHKFKYKDPPVVDPRTDRRCNPGEDYQCRCVAEPVLPSINVAA